ncbi:hypothetical protein QJQ45_001805 [Haematococcus lacustris]|nr:hypothetical protein QJQ45_001805 [Haematococcus lacustris]
MVLEAAQLSEQLYKDRMSGWWRSLMQPALARRMAGTQHQEKKKKMMKKKKRMKKKKKRIKKMKKKKALNRLIKYGLHQGRTSSTPQPGKWLDRGCNSALSLQRSGKSVEWPQELFHWPDRTPLCHSGIVRGEQQATV